MLIGLKCCTLVKTSANISTAKPWMIFIPEHCCPMRTTTRSSTGVITSLSIHFTKRQLPTGLILTSDWSLLPPTGALYVVMRHYWSDSTAATSFFTQPNPTVHFALCAVSQQSLWITAITSMQLKATLYTTTATWHNTTLCNFTQLMQHVRAYPCH